MTGNCTRCGVEGALAVPIFKPQGMTWFTPSTTFEVPQAEFVCANCITDDELARMLYPAMNFVLSTIPRNSNNAVALEYVQAYFTVRNNSVDGRNRSDALKAVGLL